MKSSRRTTPVTKEEKIHRAVREIRKGDAEYVYFFEHANSPSWLNLYQHGFFQTPPRPDRGEKYLSFRPWPESQYLVRMAALPSAQSVVLDLVLKMQSTDNPFVHDDLADIALTLPVDMAAKIVPLACQWTESPFKRQLGEKLGALIVRLAKSGQLDSALDLARAALSMASGNHASDDTGEAPLKDSEPKAKLQQFQYEQVVELILPPLVDAAGLAALQLFADILDEYATLARDPTEPGDDDYFHYRQARLENPKDPFDLASTLICAVRDISERVIRDDNSRFGAVIEVLKGKRWSSFRRLELHLGRLFPDHGVRLAEEFFQEPKSLEKRSLQHEAALLLQSVFSKLNAETQERILAWIDRGPERSRVQQWLEMFSKPVTEEMIQDFSDARRRDLFAILEGQLPEKYQTEFTRIVERLGKGRPFGEPARITGGAFGPRSPKSIDELKEMTSPSILSYLASWQPGSDMFSETAEGLGRNFVVIVEDRPNEFVAAAEEFKTLAPTYVRSFLEGLQRSLTQGKMFEWRPVLDLMIWIATQPREILGLTGGLMIADPDWGWSRGAVIELLKSGLDRTSGDGGLACVDRPLVWRVLRPLTDDPFPSVEDEAHPHFDPASLSINSTRGRALYAVIQYAWWVRQCLEGEGHAGATFSSMPEVREVLELHLNPQVDATLTVRAFYGESIRSFAGIDWDWFVSNLDRILPGPGAEADSRFIAAWESFVVFTQPHPLFLDVLSSAYARAVARIGQPGLVKHPASPDSRLAEHLMVYYWWGKLDLANPEGLLQRFYTAASSDLRAHAVWFARHFFSESNAPPEALQRLRDLIEMRLDATGRSSAPEHFFNELAAFGYWFIEGPFDEVWALETLLRTLRFSHRTEHETEVVRRLVAMCPVNPTTCIECLALIVEGDKERWTMAVIEPDTREILKLAMASNVPDAVLAARHLAQHLIKLGYYAFRKLLD